MLTGEGVTAGDTGVTADAQPLSVRAYARHRGVSAPAVLRAIKAGRLSACLVRDSDGKAKIADVALADSEWAASTDLSRAPAYVKARDEERDPSKGGRPAVGAAPSALSEASRREKEARAALAELQLAREAGELVRASDTVRAWEQKFVQFQAGILGVPAWMKGQFPHLTHVELAALHDKLCAVLELLVATPKGKA